MGSLGLLVLVVDAGSSEEVEEGSNWLGFAMLPLTADRSGEKKKKMQWSVRPLVIQSDLKIILNIQKSIGVRRLLPLWRGLEPAHR